MNCKLAKLNDVDELIDRYLAGKLPEKEAEHFEQHFLECDDCFQKLSIREQMLTVVREKGEQLFEEFLKPSLRAAGNEALATRLHRQLRLTWRGKRRWAYAAGLVAMVLAAMLYWTRDDIAPTLAENFREHPAYEELIANQEFQRSGEAVKLLAPSLRARFEVGAEIAFRWEAQPGGSADLKILNNAGDRLFDFKVEGNEFVLREDLPAGLYYWKIETGDDFRMGKFFVTGGR